MEQKVLQYFILILFARAQEEYKIHSGPPPHTHPISLHPTSTGSSPMSRLCPAGCATCSALNGCLSCKPRLFFHLELDGMRQRGTCLSTCPRGHYGMRSRHISTCTRCKEDCASCFSEHFCTHCHLGHFLFRGKCENSCPNGLTANAALRECTECSVGCEVCVRRNMCVRCRAGLYFLHGQCHLTCPRGFEPDVQFLQCVPQVHCQVGEWTDWGPCVRKRSMRAYRRGEETRTRQVLQSPSLHGDPCPHVSEIRKCVIKKRPKSPNML
ncbi:R-spondin-3-like isoform X1 [Dicentrarchus labrax]|uniref:R-spondin-3-like isoform X1 n=1 Tax=Dicentrarchus labrax TaxID=13489 RepID=UPI0021F56599|nr:R-spondin-3-like isoform X1 [Dicentrarchus labrax]